MPKLTIDGREIEVAGGNLIQAARELGIEIPHFCWHPQLSVAANCRMCLVEIEKQPKLQPACQIAAADGMVVRTDGPRVREARRAVLEFLLLNHPVDCPICDQAGECKLQDYYVLHDLKPSRLWSENLKLRKAKRTALGPHVVHDAERCVMCTRCVRFCAEVAGDPVLIEINRGDHSAVGLAPGRTLDHAYSLMTAHVCPVGALTSRDFRFRCRAWFLSASPVVCPGCATGCNAFIDHWEGRAYRLRPRDNPDVNRCWLCDEGVLAGRLHDDRRLATPEIGRGEAKAAAWPEALAEAAALLSRAPQAARAAILSAEHTCEENHALVVFAREALGVERFFLAERPAWPGDAILRHPDRNPNRAGVRLVLGADPEPLGALLDAAVAGSVRAVVALGSEASCAAGPVDAGLLRLEALVSIAPRPGPLPAAAHVRLPSVSFAETAGTYVNARGRAQEFPRAIAPRGEALEVHEVLARLARRLDLTMPFRTAADVREAVAPRLAPAGAGGRS